MLLKQPDRRVDPDQWKKMVHYWESPEGQACSERNEKNRNNSLMTHHLGTNSFARLREEKTNIGVEFDNLGLFMIAYGQPTRKPIDPQSSKLIAEIEDELLNLPLDCDVAIERERISHQSIGDDKRGYKRTYGIGVKNEIAGTSKQRATEALLMVEAERQKRKDLEEEIAIDTIYLELY